MRKNCVCRVSHNDETNYMFFEHLHIFLQYGIEAYDIVQDSTCWLYVAK